jgi:hypothetical protein
MLCSRPCSLGAEASGRTRASQRRLSICLCAAAALWPSVSPDRIQHVSVRRNTLGCSHMQDRCVGGGLDYAARHVSFFSSEDTGCSALFASIGYMADEAERWSLCMLAGADPTDSAAAAPTGLRSRWQTFLGSDSSEETRLERRSVLPLRLRRVSRPTPPIAHTTTVSARIATADGGVDRPRQRHDCLTKARTGIAVWDGTLC